VAEFLLAGGQSASWLAGNSIVTVTTSGGSQVGRSGLCDKCTRVARAAVRPRSPLVSSQNKEEEDSLNRRRHRSAAVFGATDATPLLPLLSQVKLLTQFGIAKLIANILINIS